MLRTKFILLLIVLIALALRFNGLDWDADFHLHPDERFLTMVGNAMKVPHTIQEYLDPQNSKMNPTNIGFNFYVYGTFPLVLNKFLALWSGNDTYNGFTLQGRALSALFDIGVLFFVYGIARLLVGEGFPASLGTSKPSRTESKQSSIPLWSAFFYAIAVLPIQLSHFFAVDTFLNFFMIGSFYFALRFYSGGGGFSRLLRDKQTLPYSALFFGLALACKVTAVFILPLNLFLILLGLNTNLKFLIFNLNSNFKFQISNLRKLLGYIILFTSIYIIICYIALRFAAPYYFESSNPLNPNLNTLFVTSLKSLKSFEGKDIWYPPAVQWMNKTPVLFSLQNLALVGLGLPYFILTVLGIVRFGRGGFSRLLRDKQTLPYKLVNLIILIWTLGFFLFQSTQFVKTMRYFIFIYPFLSIFAAYGITLLLDTVPRYTASNAAIRYTLYGVLLIVVLIWPLAFSSIYIQKHSRVTASKWIYERLPGNTLILSEHWDDGLPLPMSENFGKQYQYEQLPVFDPDTDAKWLTMQNLLSKGDYYMLTSNRAWGSVPTVPDKYPKMTQFYHELLNDQLPYKKIAEFTSYPSLRYLGIPVDFPDDWAEEAFSVYDHPKVMIYSLK